MDLNRIIKRNTDSIYDSGIASEPSPEEKRENVSDSPIAEAGQEAPSLAKLGEDIRRTVKVLNPKGELSIKLLNSLKQKNLEEVGTRTQIFKILNTKNESAQTLLQQVYESRNEAYIRTVEETLGAVLNSVVCIGSRTPRGIFQLLEVLNPKEMGAVEAYLEDYLESLKAEGETHSKEALSWDEATLNSVLLYCVYGGITRKVHLLKKIGSLVKGQPADVQAQFEEKIKLSFGYFLNDLKEPYCRAYFRDSSVYDDVLLNVCSIYPSLLEELYSELLSHFLQENSQSDLIQLLIFKTPNYACFLDLLYSKIEPGAVIKAQNRADTTFLSTLAQFQDWLHAGFQVPRLIPIFRNLQLPHLLDYLSKVPFDQLSKDEKIRYLCLSISLKHIGCINRFKRIRIETEEESGYFQIIIVKLFQDLFEIDNEGKPLDRSLEYSLFKEGVAPTDSKELFFTILECLKPLDVLVCPPLMAILLSHSLKGDIIAPASSSTFDYVLDHLVNLGFDLHFIEPAKKSNLLFEAFDLRDIDLIKKLIELGLNPFLFNQDGLSFFTLEAHLDRIPNMRDFHKQWTAQNLSTLSLVGLDQHRFLSQSFREKLCKTGEGLHQVDEQKRTPLMLLVQCNQDIQPILRHLKMEDLEAQDKNGKSPVDYARGNNNKIALNFLEKRIKNLRKKSGLRKFASRLVKENQSQQKAISPEIKSNSGKAKAQRGAAKAAEHQKNINTVQEIHLDYNTQTGDVKTSYSKREIQQEVDQKIKKEERKQKLKKERAHKEKEENVSPQADHPKKSLYEKAKHTVETVRKALEVTTSVGSSPNALVERWAGRMSGAINSRSLSRAQTLLNLTKEKPIKLLGDGSNLGAFNGLMDLVRIVLKEDLKLPPQGHILKTLESMEEVVRKNSRMKIERRKILEALKWMVGGEIEEGKGSHLNLRFAGGGLTIPRNRDQSENADIVYIRQAADIMERSLRSLILGYEEAITPDDDSVATDKPEPSE